MAKHGKSGWPNRLRSGENTGSSKTNLPNSEDPIMRKSGAQFNNVGKGEMPQKIQIKGKSSHISVGQNLDLGNQGGELDKRQSG